MKTSLLFLVLFSVRIKASSLSFSISIDFDSENIGRELSVGFKTESHSATPIFFDTTRLDSFNFRVVREAGLISFAITDPVLRIIELPFTAQILRSVSIRGNLFGSDMSPDMYVQSLGSTFFHSMGQGMFEIETSLFAESMLSGEFQNFSGETGRFHVEIIASHVPEVWVLPHACTALALLSRRKRDSPPRA